jgi:hypothetical protein
MSNDITNKRDLISLSLMAIAVVLLVFTLLRLTSLAVGAKGDPNVVSELLSQNQSDPSRVKEHLAYYQECAQALQKKNLFAPPPKPPQPPKQCTAILGNEAFIDGKWVKVGDTVGAGAKVLAVEAAQVKLDWKGKEIILAPIQVASSEKGSREPSPPRPEMKERRAGKGKEMPEEKPVEIKPADTGSTVQIESGKNDDDPLAWLGVDLPDGMREKFLQMWNMMPEEQKEKAKEEWAKMPEEQKQQAIEAWSRHL